MEGKNRCQSCGMPLGVGFYGTNADGTASDTYCKFCFEQGQFREPNLQLSEMIGRSSARMIDDQQMDQAEAEELAKTLIPTLSRWVGLSPKDEGDRLRSRKAGEDSGGSIL